MSPTCLPRTQTVSFEECRARGAEGWCRRGQWSDNEGDERAMSRVQCPAIEWSTRERERGGHTHINGAPAGRVPPVKLGLASPHTPLQHLLVLIYSGFIYKNLTFCSSNLRLTLIKRTIYDDSPLLEVFPDYRGAARYYYKSDREKQGLKSYQL